MGCPRKNECVPLVTTPMRAAVAPDRRAVPRDVARLGLEPDQRPARARPALTFGQRFAADEVALVELHGPAQAGLVRVDRLVHVVAVQAQRGLEARRVARAQAGRQHAAARRPCSRIASQTSPTRSDVDEELEAVLARVAGARDHRRGRPRPRRCRNPKYGRSREPARRAAAPARFRPLERDQRELEGSVLDRRRPRARARASTRRSFSRLDALTTTKKPSSPQ